MPQVFISHSSKDRAFVEREIITPIRRKRIGVWYSPLCIGTSEEWEASIRMGLEESDWFLVVLSPHSTESRWVQHEVHWAMENRCDRFVPVLFEECALEQWHIGLRRYQCVDFRLDTKVARRRLLAVWSDKGASTKSGRRLPHGTSEQAHTLGAGLPPLSRIVSNNSGSIETQAEFAEIEIVIDRDFDSFTRSEQDRVLEAIRNLVGLTGEIRLISKHRGSVKLILALSPEEAEKLYWAIDKGNLDKLGITAARLISEAKEDPREHRTPTCPGTGASGERSRLSDKDDPQKATQPEVSAANMATGLVICRDTLRRSILQEVHDLAPTGSNSWESFSTVNHAEAFLKKNPAGVRFILFSLVGGGPPAGVRYFLFRVVGGGTPEECRYLSTLTRAPIVAELDGDYPQLAFRLLGHGACHVVASAGFRSKKLWDVLSKTMNRAGQPVHSPLLDGIQRPRDRWGVMCMSDDTASKDHNDYEFAIRPAMKRLGLDLKRCDEIPTQEFDLVGQIEAAMKDRLVVVALNSPHSPRTNFELGIAHVLNKPLLLLYRERSGKILEFLNRYKYIDYGSMTELALKLFFGLGGTDQDLLPEDRPPAPGVAPTP